MLAWGGGSAPVTSPTLTWGLRAPIVGKAVTKDLRDCIDATGLLSCEEDFVCVVTGTPESSVLEKRRVNGNLGVEVGWVEGGVAIAS